MEEHWDKIFAKKLTNMGIGWETAMAIVGLVAEERMCADLVGYKRGYTSGYAHAALTCDIQQTNKEKA